MHIDAFYWGVGWMTALGAASFAMLLLNGRMILYRYRLRSLSALQQDSFGGAYILPVVLMVPFITFFLVMTIEVVILLYTRMVAQSAVIDAARAAVVYLPEQQVYSEESPDYLSREKRLDKMRWAAAKTLWPAASGAAKHATEGGLIHREYAANAIDGFKLFGKVDFDADYLQRKLEYAFRSTKIEVTKLEPSPSTVGFDPVEVMLQYEAPFHTPVLGRFFGRRSEHGDFYVMDIKVKIAIDQEIPRTKNGSLGIRYYDQSSPSHQ